MPTDRPAGGPILLTALALVPLLVGCAGVSSSGSSGGDPLRGTAWVLTTRFGGMADVGPSRAQIDLAFDAGQVGGSSGCNHYSGPYTVDGPSLSIGALATTEMACPEPVMTIESQYLQMLAKVEGFEVGSGGQALTLSGPNVELAFRAQTPAVDLPFTGTRWRLTTIGGPGDTVSSTLAGTKVEAVFAEDGTVSGSDGCNAYSGPYTAGANGSLQIGMLMSTAMACAEPVMDQAHTFTTALARTSSYAIDGTALSLSDADGKLLLAFEGTAA